MESLLSRYWRGVVDFRWIHFGRKCVRTAIYPRVVIQASLGGIIRSLRGEEDDTESNRVKQYKLMEVLGLSLSNKNILINALNCPRRSHPAACHQVTPGVVLSVTMNHVIVVSPLSWRLEVRQRTSSTVSAPSSALEAACLDLSRAWWPAGKMGICVFKGAKVNS